MSTKTKGHQESRLIQGLQEFFPNQQFTQSELKNPTRDFVIRFYLDFLSNVGINTDALCQVPPGKYEMFGETYTMRRIYVALREVFNRTVMSDQIAAFNMLDLLQPCHGRTVAFFMAMCNFMCFCVSKLFEVDQYIDALQAEKEDFDRLLEEREAIRQKLNEEAQTRARISDLEAEVLRKQHELRRLAEDGNAADKSLMEKENAIKNLEEKLEQMNKKLVEHQKEMASTEALVVRSPVSVKNQKSLLEQKLTEAEEKTASAKDMLTSKREISRKLETLGEELEVRTTLLEKIIAESKEISNDEKLTEEQRRKLTKLREVQDNRNAERQKLRERELHLQETESGFLLRFETKKNDFQGRLKAMQRDLDNLMKQTSGEKISLQHAVDKTGQEISRLVIKYSGLCEKYEELYRALLLKEKSIGDEAVEELQEVIAKFQKEI